MDKLFNQPLKGMDGGANIFMTKVAPGLGVVIATLMFGASLPAVRSMRKTNQLGVGLGAH